ncbi:siderophore iron transporter [Fusarium denticulatum]|uniref:Siderophore iron transporter n=1 Tax=Fusarium denticulatum TaxID=48507 RepID=A0A8H5UA06_9HYPO|nr:siderophore iron transporter [Fusarium denticulatum]
MMDKADTESRGRDGHLDKVSVPATQETVFEHKLDPTFANRDSEAIKVTDSDDEKEIPGALQQIMTRNEQILTHVLIWLLVFALGFSNSIFRVLTPYVVSDYKRHALTATTDVVANIASGIFRLPYAKLLDVWGRPQSLSLMVLFTVLGAVMKAGCNSVETYCAAQVFYYVGYYGIQFSLVIFISDSAPIRNRALLFGIVWSPSLISTWAYGPTADRVLTNLGYRWGFGVWCIIIPAICAPVIALMFRFDKRARQAGLIKRPDHGKTISQRIIFYLKEFDIVGLLILAAGLSLLLLSLSIYSYQDRGWGSPLIICFLVFGPLLVVCFVLYEIYLAPVTFLSSQLLKDRTVVWTNIMAATLYTSEFICSAYIYSMLIVVFNQSITAATYINSIYYIGSSFWTIVLGFMMRYYGRLKIYTLVLGIPLFILGQGMMIAFQPGFTPIGLMVVCKILIAFGGGTMYPIEQMTLMAVSQEHTPALLAVESVIIDVGKGAGSAIATAIWTGMFRKKLAEYLPPSELLNLDDIYGSLDVQSSYPLESAARIAINHAYLDTQRIIFISSTSLLGLTWASVLFWKDYDVKKMSSHRKGMPV